MNTRTIIVLGICALLLVSSIDCKKVKKNVKEVKEKKVVKIEEPVVAELVETVPETVNEADAESKPAHSEPEAVSQKHRITPPKSLKVTSAYEQCKLECRKARDAVQAKDYVEQLRQELAVAEAALASEIELTAAAEEHVPEASH